MGEGSRSTKQSRLTRRHFLAADIETGFALVRAARDAYLRGEREHAGRQLDEARLVIQDTCHLMEGLGEGEVKEFAGNVDELKRAIEAVDHLKSRRVATGEWKRISDVIDEPLCSRIVDGDIV